jgi:hypothetical protein
MRGVLDQQHNRGPRLWSHRHRSGLLHAFHLVWRSSYVLAPKLNISLLTVTSLHHRLRHDLHLESKL